MNDKKYLPQEYLDNLIQMGTKLFNFLNKHKVPYWIDGGTLLGCIREQGQIKHDDDIDIGVFFKGFKQILELKPLIEKECGVLVLIYSQGQIKIGTPEKTYIIHDKEKCCCFDVFLYRRKNNRIDLDYELDRNLYPNAYHKDIDFEPFKKVKYEGILVNSPKNPYGYLERLYGNWKTPVIYTNHFE